MGKRQFTAPGPALQIVDGEVPVAELGLARLREELERRVGILESEYFVVAELLSRAFDIGANRDWGYPLWRDYVEEVLSMSDRKAGYLITIHKWKKAEVRQDADLERVKKLGWSKAKLLARVATEENLEEWLQRAEEMTVIGLETFIQTIQAGGDPGKNGAADAASMSFKLFPAQQENVESALELAGEMAESDKKGHQLDLICTTFLTDHVLQLGPGEKMLGAMLKKVATLADVNMIASERGSNAIIIGKGHINRLVDALPHTKKTELLQRLQKQIG